MMIGKLSKGSYDDYKTIKGKVIVIRKLSKAKVR
jgi:hypothetical protein